MNTAAVIRCCCMESANMLTGLAQIQRSYDT